MNFIVSVFWLLSLLPTHIVAQTTPPPPAPQTCSSPIYIGNTDPTPIPVQSGHGAGQSVIVYDPGYTISCTCGLLTGWELIRYDNATDGCKAYPCHAAVMVYRNLNISAMTATLVGYYNTTKIESYPIQSTNYIVITIPPANWIKVQYGDYLGWEGSPSPVTYYEEPTCTSPCPSGLASTSMYFYGSNKNSLTAGTQIGFFNGPTNSYSKSRYFGFRATVKSGTAPYFTNLPATLNLNDSIAVGTVIFTVKATDNETKQNLTLKVTWDCPFTSYFDMNPNTGDVTVIRSLLGGPTLHTLAIEVSDDCFTANANLTIYVTPTLTTTLPPTTVPTTPTPKEAPNVLKSPVGASLLAITILASLVAIGASIGMCFLGSQISNITKELGEIPPIKKPQTIPNNERIPPKNERLPKSNYNQERGNLVNRKQNNPEYNMNREAPGSRTKPPSQYNPRSGTPTRLTPTPTKTNHGASPSTSNRLTPVEQLSKAYPSPRASPHNYPPRDMLYW